MQVKIGKEITKFKPRNTYKVVITTITGDADDEHEIVCYPSSIEELTYVCLIIKELSLLSPEGFSRDDLPNNIKRHFPYLCELEKSWHSTNGWCDSYDCHTITYFNNQGEEFEVEVKLDKEDKLTNEVYNQYITNGE